MKRRIFLAIKPPPEILKELLSIQQAFKSTPTFQRLRKQCRWVRQENIHLIFHFLGGIETSVLDALLDDLEEIRQFPSHELRLDHTLFFPQDRRARVGGMGGHQVHAETQALWKRSKDLVENHGIELEQRRYYPHVTLVRFRPPSSIRSDELAPVALTHPIRALSVYESFMGGAPPQPYKIIRDFPLASTP